MKHALIEAKGLGKHYRTGLFGGARVALRRVDLVLRQGDGLALVGPNGAGKSTLLLLLAGLRRPTAGELRVHGLPPDAPEARRALGILPERPALPRGPTVRAALETWARLHLLPDVGRRVEETLDRLRLSELAHHRVGELSQGGRQRLALARALVHGPALLLLDEPLANLDPDAARVVLEVLAEERARGVTLLVATHRLADLAPVCPQVASMSEGTLHLHGPTDQFLAHLPTRVVFVLPEGVAPPKVGRALPADGDLHVRIVPAGRRDLLVARILEVGGSVVRLEPVMSLRAPAADLEETLA